MREARREAGRRISFLIAEKSMRRRFVGSVARAISASTMPSHTILNYIVPVMRAQDLTKSHPGTISLHDRTQPLIITGSQTKFTTLNPGMSLVLPHDVGAAEIASIESDEALTLKREFRGLRALELLEVPGGTEFKVAPKVDQSWVYEKVFERIEEGGCIGIYPEGGSHDRPDLLPLKGPSFLVIRSLTTSWGSCNGIGSTSEEPGYRLEDYTMWNELLPSPQISVESSHRIRRSSHCSPRTRPKIL